MTFPFRKPGMVLAFLMGVCSLNACSMLDVLDSGSDSGNSSYSGSYDTDDDSEVSGTSSEAGTSGTLTADDGTPIAGAAVALSVSSDSSLSLVRDNLRNEYGRIMTLAQVMDDDGVTCDDITGIVDGEILATDCTGSDGRYELSAENVPCDTPVTFTAKKGTFLVRLNITLSCDDSREDVVDIGDVEFDDDCGQEEGDDDSSCDFERPDIAVVTGAFDEIQNVLAKLGLGETDAIGRLDTDEDYDFDLIDGIGWGGGGTVMSVEDLLNNPDALNDYDIVFINCGTSFEEILFDADVLENLQEYVEQGGRLYVTDLSYDYIEQAFPDFMDFYGSDSGDPTRVEAMDAAEYGRGGITTDADVNNDTMAEWLDQVSVNDGDMETADCWSLDDDDINGQVGARNADGTITIGDFLSGWSLMNSTYAGDSTTTVWISGPVAMSSGRIEDVPLTVTKEYGEGRILYSSYHTAHSCPTSGFWPQERVLQYLVFEL